MNVFADGPRRCLSQLGIVVLMCLGGCAAPKATPPPPAMTASIAMPGTPLTGATGDPAALAASPGETLVDVEWIALRQSSDALAPVDAYATLTVAPLAGVSVMPSGRATRAVRFGYGADADAYLARLPGNGQSMTISRESGVVVPGTTRRFQLATNQKQPASIDVALSPVKGPATQPSTAMLAIGVSQPGQPRETALIPSLPYGPDVHYAIIAPLAFQGTPWTAVVAAVRVSTIDADADARKQLQQDLQQSLDATKAGLPGDLQTLSTALAALKSSRSPRASLLFLAAISKAAIASDYLLAVDDKTVAELATHVADDFAAGRSPAMPDLQWRLDSTVLRAMCDLAGKNTLPPEQATVLALHTGDLARRTDVIVDLLKSARSSDEFDQRVVAENTIALEDSSPAVRVRAYDWLSTRKKAPAGFDPLADAKTRRAAIDKAMNP